MDKLNLPPLTWAEIDLGAITHNIKEINKHVANGAAMMIAVKADAYGHGAVEVARAALAAGVSYLAVARIEEAVVLRDAEINAPILVLGHCLAEYVGLAADLNISVSVNSLSEAKMLAAESLRLGKTLKTHIKVDTGMGRLGLLLTQTPNVFEQVSEITSMDGLFVEGIFTHFAMADSKDKTSASVQLELFELLLSKLNEANIHIEYRHAANSAASIEMPNTHFNMVRPGIAVYGLWPSNEITRSDVELRPAMTLKSRIVHLKSVNAGFRVSYAGTYVTQKPTVIATVAIGYGDGYDRRLSNKGAMLVSGVRAHIAGRVCMDMTMIDVGHIRDVAVGDEVVLFGQQGGEYLGADEIADILDTISYEIVSTVSTRVKRIYIGGK